MHVVGSWTLDVGRWPLAVPGSEPSCAPFDRDNQVMIENLVILARWFFKHKHRFARGTEYQKILVIDLQLAPVSQIQGHGFPVGSDGFDVLNFHAQRSLTDFTIGFQHPTSNSLVIRD